MKIVILGLSITSSWGNGHATTYRSLVRELVRQGHEVTFLERDQPWYAANRDLPHPPFGRTELYLNLRQLRDRFTPEIRAADCVIVGSFVAEGIALGEWVTRVAGGTTAFYDIDTPVTLEKIGRRSCEYLSASLISRYDLYLSFTGGPILEVIEAEYDSPMARAFYCSVDPALYYPEERPEKWCLGYLGTFSADRQPALNRLLLKPAATAPDQRFVVAGPQYPRSIRWPENVERINHLNPKEHRAFYNSQCYTLNITRAAMVQAGFAPSVRLFEAAACGTTIISDAWPGLETIFRPNEEILIVKGTNEVDEILRELPAETGAQIGRRARERILEAHTSAHRVLELEHHIASARGAKPATARRALRAPEPEMVL